MSTIPAQLSSLARNALSWLYQPSLPTTAILQTSAQTVCTVLLQDAMPYTSSAAQRSVSVHHTAVSSSHVGHSKHDEHEEQAPLLHHTCNQGFTTQSAAPASVPYARHTAPCLLDHLRQHAHFPHSTRWSMQPPSHYQATLSRWHASPQHVRHISSSVTCWRPPQTNQDNPHARAPLPRPMYPMRNGRGLPQDGGEVPAHSLGCEPHLEQQRPPFQRSSPPHARQLGESILCAARLKALQDTV